jgi:hypothetical protein
VPPKPSQAIARQSDGCCGSSDELAPASFIVDAGAPAAAAAPASAPAPAAAVPAAAAPPPCSRLPASAHVLAPATALRRRPATSSLSELRPPPAHDKPRTRQRPRINPQLYH